MTGLLALNHNKNMSEMSKKTGCETTAHSFSYFLSGAIWSYEELCKIIRIFILNTFDLNEIIFTLDESGIPKSGNSSVGSARQYCGNSGKVDLCQVGVFLGIQWKNIRLIFDYRLYLPEDKASDITYSQKFGIPLEKMIFKKKCDLALEMIDSLKNEGIQIKKIVMDGFYGVDSHFLSALDEREIIFVADIACTTQVYISKPELYLPERKGSRGPMPSKLRVSTEAFKVGDLSHDKKGWERIEIRATERGYKYVWMKSFRVWRRENEMPVEKPLWLIMSYDENGKKMKYSYCNLPLTESNENLVYLQSSRYWIERTFQDAKGMCGMSDLRGRSWNSWHRHMALVMAALAFLNSYYLDLIQQNIAIRITGILKIFKFHYPLKKLTSEDVANSINDETASARSSRNSRLKNTEI